MPQDQKNFFLAMALALLVLLLWDVWFMPKPEPTNPDEQTTLSSTQQSTQNTNIPSPFQKDETTSSPKIYIETERLKGSIQQEGMIWNDLFLTNYRKTVDENSPPVHWLKPNHFSASFGWSSPFGDIVNAETQWQSSPATEKKTLTQKQPLSFSYRDKETGLHFHRTIFVDDHYLFRIEDKIINQGARAQQLSAWGWLRRFERPIISGFYLLHEGLIGFFSETGLEEIDYDDLEDDPRLQFRATKGWLGITDKYWAATLIPDQQYAFNAYFDREVRGQEEAFITRYQTDPISLAPGETHQTTRYFFAGAKKTDLIDHYRDQYQIVQFDLMIDWGWFFFMTKPFFLLLDFFSKLFGSFGMSILMVTILVKLSFFSLVNRSYKTMAAMRQMQPDIERLRARHQGDMMAQNRAIAELWKKHEVKPLMGCLPMLLQIPVFFALYKVLFVTIEMRHAPFFGWINDLSAPDPYSLFNLFGLLPFSLPDWLIIGPWPLLMGLTMFVQMRLNPPPPDPVQRRIFAWAPLVITLLLARFPVGLVIYATWNTVLSALQQGFIMYRQGVKIDLFSNLGIKK